MLFPGRIYILQGPWYFGDYRNMQNVGIHQKLPSERGTPGTVP